jgi:hypothetical protein
VVNYLAVTGTSSLASRRTGVCFTKFSFRLGVPLDLAVTVAGAGVAIAFGMVGA